MRISKRTMSMILALVLALSVTAFGTVAYMTDRDSVTNTFTVGNISIIVDEENVDQDVGPNGEMPERDQANEYKLIPGLPQKKDPKITVLAGSEECYVRFRLSINMAKEIWWMMTEHGVTINSAEEFLAQMVDIDTENWQFIKYYEATDGSGATVFEFWHKLPGATDAVKVNAMLETQPLPSLFAHFTVPSCLTQTDVAQLDDLQVVANGDAIQTAAFDDAKAAWNAFDNQFGIGS